MMQRQQRLKWRQNTARNIYVNKNKMADNQQASSAADEIQSSLLQARDLIVQIIDGVSNSPSTANTSTANTSTVRTPNTSTAYSSTVRTPLLSEQQRVNTPNNTNLHNRALEEHRRLFGFSGQSIVSSTLQSHGKRSRGKGGKNGKSAKKPKVATWTHAFVCLAKRTQVLLLTPRERYELKSAGLGEKKITVEIKDKGFEDLYGILLQEFPLLSHAGGIELMRTGFAARSKTLEVIPVPNGSSSYSIEYLKEVLQQAKCYVRPIQKDLPVVIPRDCQGNLNTSTNEVRL
jgi:hypothetical protein